ncbi:o-succinylbenzoate synthase [Liquorilactobacillus cacaonum]|uniref:o-succinylbenzoate synthase n=1 Tax=Liquorilactobacillus cacaonum DSM 21116 TaxID=1423729 RepID=A0A0R2CDR9_9LACO|nr:o-succinylbenzoate synthase [Liquorilactobacillus cacaonum]KRM89901.1 o-succinylbenzoate synthase [Liquorilactobacillus cacaonum DSM 21116]
MFIKSVKMYKVDLPLNKPFETSFAAMKYKKCVILELKDKDGTIGYGESSALEVPFYNEEFRDGSFELLRTQMLPRIMNVTINHPDEIYDIFSYIRMNNMSKAAINCALWDIYAQQKNQTLAQALGGDKVKVETGVSIGVQNSPEDLVVAVAGYIKDGYRRIKMKIKPGKDYEYIAAVRKNFPEAMLMADANSAYRLKDIEMLKKLDDLNLIMIEQPLEPGDLIDHAALQAQLKTSICLDESIVSLDDVEKMVQLKSGKIINIKVARVGGLGMAKRIQDLAMKNGIECWCGGMLDSGIARAANVAIATLPGYTLPNDIAASHRYYDADIIKPTVELDGTFVNVSNQTGLGYDIDSENLKKFMIEKIELN